MISGTYHILLIEDNPGDVLLVEEALRVHGLAYRLTRHETVDSAVRAVNNYTGNGDDIPDLLLLDYNLPRGDARSVLIAAANNPALARTAKAVITSSVAPRDRDDALKNGADCFIYKPAELESFLNEVGSKIAALLVKS
jgi:CheY-like chemotaxis protein